MAETVTIDLVTHSRIDIAATAASIWPHILEPHAWKQGLQPVHHSGPAQGLGERQIAFGEDGVTVVLILDTVALITDIRKTIKITMDSSPVSWASWTLAEHGGVTTVSYDVYGLVSLPADALEGMGISVAGYVQMNQARFDSELLGLREIVLRQQGTDDATEPRIAPDP